MQRRPENFIQVKITLFRRCHQRHTLVSRKSRVAITIISLLHLLSLTDILGFDPAVRCHPLSLALPGACFLFYLRALSLSLSLSCLVLHFTIFSPSPFSPFPLSTFPLSLPLSPPRSYSLAISVSVSRTEEGSAPGNSFAETWHRTAKHE